MEEQAIKVVLGIHQTTFRLRLNSFIRLKSVEHLIVDVQMQKMYTLFSEIGHNFFYYVCFDYLLGYSPSVEGEDETCLNMVDPW